MRQFSIILLCMIAVQAFGQKSIPPTEEFLVTGSVNRDVTVKISDLKNYPSVRIKKVRITNHLGVYKGTLKQLRGIRIVDLLKPIEITAPSPRALNEYCLIFEAADGYKAVFSWNEVFNSPTGRNIFVITRKGGVDCSNLNERIMVLAPRDLNTGRRYIKCLTRITIQRVN